MIQFALQTRKSRFLRIIPALLLLLVCFLTTTSSAAAQGQTGLVLAFYYAWYDPGSFGPGLTPYQPAVPYQSSDPAVIQRHVGEAKSAGIDAFVQSWYGPAPNQTETNLQTLLNVAAANGFRVAVDFEVGSPYFGSSGDRVDALTHLLSTHANHSAYLRVDGKPVIFFWANWLLTVGEWSTIRNQVDPGRNSIWIAEGANSDYLSVFDGLHLYNTAWSDYPASTAATWGGITRTAANTYGSYKYWIATAMPGFNDSLLGRGDATVIRDRAGGTYYQASFSGAASSSPDMIIITSFNEWREGSNIEPSLEFGDFYLQLTSQMSAAFKSGSVLPAPPVPPLPTVDPAAPSNVTPTAGPSPTATAKPSATPFPTPVASPTPQADGSIVYEVQIGDSIFGIAALFDVSVQDLFELNDLDADSILRVGQRIIIGSGSAEPGSTDDEFPGTITRADGTVIYVVAEGDALLGIADRFGLEFQELLELNEGLTGESVLRVGQELIVGKRPVPQNVGGSTDLPSPEPIATSIPTVEPTPTPTSITAAATAAISTSLPVETMPDLPSENEGNGEDSLFSNQLMLGLIGVSALLAGTGALFIYLSRKG